MEKELEELEYDAFKDGNNVVKDSDIGSAVKAQKDSHETQEEDTSTQDS